MATRQDFDGILAEFCKTAGIDPVHADDTGLVSMRVDDAYNVNLQYIDETGKVLLFVEVAELPPEAGKAVYRELLVGGLFGKETAGGYFAVEPNTETVVYNLFFDLETIAGDMEDFVDAIEKTLQLCDYWAERIHSMAEEQEPAAWNGSLITP